MGKYPTCQRIECFVSCLASLILRDVSFSRLLQQCCSVSSNLGSIVRMYCIDCIVYLFRQASLRSALSFMTLKPCRYKYNIFGSDFPE